MPKITKAGGPSIGTKPGDDIARILADFGVTEAEKAEIATVADPQEPAPEPVPAPRPNPLLPTGAF